MGHCFLFGGRCAGGFECAPRGQRLTGPSQAPLPLEVPGECHSVDMPTLCPPEEGTQAQVCCLLLARVLYENWSQMVGYGLNKASVQVSSGSRYGKGLENWLTLDLFLNIFFFPSCSFVLWLLYFFAHFCKCVGGHISRSEVCF